MIRLTQPELDVMLGLLHANTMFTPPLVLEVSASEIFMARVLADKGVVTLQKINGSSSLCWVINARGKQAITDTQEHGVIDPHQVNYPFVDPNG